MCVGLWCHFKDGGVICVFVFVFYVCCFASGFIFLEVLSREKKLRRKLLWNLFQEMVAFGGEWRNLTRRIKGRKNRLQWHFNFLEMSWFLWVNKVVEKYYVVSFEVEKYCVVSFESVSGYGTYWLLLLFLSLHIEVIVTCWYFHINKEMEVEGVMQTWGC